MNLDQLLAGIDYLPVKGKLDVEIHGVYYDSRRVTPGSLFVCITGFKTDGHLYIKQAINNGAIAILAEREIATEGDIAYILVPDTRKALPIVAAHYYGHCSRFMRVVGITGTNGKTTTAHLIKAILDEAGKKTGIIGTLYAEIGDDRRVLGHTTPEALEIEDFMNFSYKQQAEYIIMEVSSHALELSRVDKIYFNTAILTNLTQDHLDYHGDMDNYRRAKIRLFSMIPKAEGNFCIVNADDESANYFIKEDGPLYLTYGVKNPADIRAADLEISLEGSRFQVIYKDQKFLIRTKLIGLFSVYNALAAIAFALQEGIDIKTIKAALKKVEGVPGRFEPVSCGQNFTVLVDYAHTPDGLENILKTARQIAENRVITVFGCGGDRDRTKRPIMGKIAASYSDFCIITSDNPRSEEPEAIIREICSGIESVDNCRYAIIVDRREAIRHAVYLAKEKDLVIIAGKGHETYQIVKDQVLEFDDRKIAAEFLKGKVSNAD
ncbi:MAG: UDP-N-acetylmuramoyl-L-alanyl-D-glutamate--2,6-diaminopimelate ligase [Syntrophomonadaceae bacterium]|jgi:UDP-N-acetylmuramoyl-L-alanyl-D-glutamate--2,6-diaminopimelate ligase